MFLVILAALLTVLDASFEPDEGETESMLVSYSNTPKIETVFVGNSAGKMVDAKLYSELTDSDAFNMCTPSQSPVISLENIELAASHHDIKKVVLLITPDVLDRSNYEGLEHLYHRVVDSSSPWYVRIFNTVKRNAQRSFARDTIGTEKSINIWIPLENENVHGLSNIRNNIKRRFVRLSKGERLGDAIAFDLNRKKYEREPGTLTSEDRSLLRQDLKDLKELDIPEGMIAEDKLDTMADICAFCRDNGIDLTVMVTPHRTDYYDRFEGYRKDIETVSNYLQDFLSERGVKYFDCENDESVHRTLPDEYFYDMEHVKSEYYDASTTYISEYLQ